MTTRAIATVGAVLALSAGMSVCGAEVKGPKGVTSATLPDWGGAPIEFEVQEHYLVQKGNRTAIDFTIADDDAWAPSGPASNCVKRTDEDLPYVRFGGDDKHVGLAHGVKPAKPVPLEAGVACTLEVAARVARGTGARHRHAHRLHEGLRRAGARRDGLHARAVGLELFDLLEVLREVPAFA